jgi:large subunit ribosomal protein L15e
MAETKKTEKKQAKAQSPSVKGLYHFIKKAWKDHSDERVKDIRQRMIAWRRGERIVKLEKPTRLDRARNLGYKAKKGVLVFRVAVKRGGRSKSRPSTKRKQKRLNTWKILRMSYQWVAEQRLQKRYHNLEVLNSYKLAKDGKYYYFEVIAIDPNMPEIKSDPNFKWLQKSTNRNRALRGLTSAAKKSRGLANKNPNMKVRPSIRAWGRKGH